MSDEIRAAAERQAKGAGPHDTDAFFQLEEDALLLARAYLAAHSHTPTPAGPPAAAPECRRCLDDHRVWSTNDETGRWLLCPECSGPPLADDGVAPLAPWRPRLVAVGDREVRLHTDDGAYRYLVHVTPGHAEPFVAAVNAAMVRGPTPDGPPAAAPERKAGERWSERYVKGSFRVLQADEPTPERPANWRGFHRWTVADDLSKEDADLLAHGPARLRAMEAALKGLVEAVEDMRVPRSGLGVFGTTKPALEAARAALGAGPGT